MNIPRLRCNVCHCEISVSLSGYVCGAFGLCRKDTKNGDTEFDVIQMNYDNSGVPIHICTSCEYALRKVFKENPQRLSLYWESDMDAFTKSEIQK